MPLLCSKPVELAHRFQNAGGRHADMLSSADDVTLSRCVAKRTGEQITHRATGVQHCRISAQFVITEQPDESVLVYPNIPAGPAATGGICAKIPIGFLARDERFRHPACDTPKLCVVLVSQAIAGGIE